MSNGTDTPSQIRFGSANEDLFAEGSLHWIKTVSSDTWKVNLAQVDF